jgi:hypothetical protein
LPLPVSLKRFLAPLWVFIFGMETDLLLIAGAVAPGIRHPKVPAGVRTCP